MESNNANNSDNFRPVYHFSPRKNWMNDPNGLVYYEGEYHLFFQHTPFSTLPSYDKMHWGHAVSKDLLNWEELPIALAPDLYGAIFSGSAVIDQNNTSGFFGERNSGLVAIYTNSDNTMRFGKRQVQSIAYSKDNGRTWTKYEENPVISHETSIDFRDPKVFWHTQSSKWIMLLAVGDKVEIYTSSNLKAWCYASSFSFELELQLGIVECPDLFELAVDNDPCHTKWVLSISLGNTRGTAINELDPNAKGARMLYFVGEFDGTTFVPDMPITSVSDLTWVDYGPDFYAAASWNYTPGQAGRTIWIGWMINTKYAELTPTDSEGWRGEMSIPRELSLTAVNGAIKLTQRPVRELENYRKPVFTLKDRSIDSARYDFQYLQLQSFEIVAAFTKNMDAEFGFQIRSGSGKETIIGYLPESGEIFIDRSRSGQRDFHPDFASRYVSKLNAFQDMIKVQILVDKSSIEVFVNDGITVMSSLIFPEADAKGFGIYSRCNDIKFHYLDIYNLASH